MFPELDQNTTDFICYNALRGVMLAQREGFDDKVAIKSVVCSVQSKYRQLYIDNPNLGYRDFPTLARLIASRLQKPTHPHPSAVLRRLMHDHSISLDVLARRARRRRSSIFFTICGFYRVTPRLARKFKWVFGQPSVEEWVDLQSRVVGVAWVTTTRIWNRKDPRDYLQRAFGPGHRDKPGAITYGLDLQQFEVSSLSNDRTKSGHPPKLPPAGGGRRG